MIKKGSHITPRPPLTSQDASRRIDLRGGGPQAEGDMVKTLTENWKRALADYHNLTKRIESDKKDFVKLATVQIISKFISSLDVLELAATHSQDPGIHMAVKQLQQALAEEGLEEIVPAVGDKYDHFLHECTETVLGENQDTIAELVFKGYKINDYVIRPAKVKVFTKTS